MCVCVKAELTSVQQCRVWGMMKDPLGVTAKGKPSTKAGTDTAKGKTQTMPALILKAKPS